MAACTQAGKEQVLKEVLESQKEDQPEKEPKKLFTGIRKSYYDEAEKILMSEVQYKDGIRDGMAVDYYENGQIRLKGGNMMGKKHGDFVYYHEDGRIYRKMSYDYGDLHGWDTLFYNSGKPKHAIPYDDGYVMPGTVEWDARYKKIPLPKIKLREVSRVETESKYFLFASFSEEVKDARFMMAVVGNGSADNPQYPFEVMPILDGGNEAVFSVQLEPGYEIAAKLVIKGIGTTKRGNPFQVKQMFPVVMR